MTARPIHVLTVVGARPQFVKAAPVSAAFAATDQIRETLVHTGQHFDEAVSGVFFRELALAEPDVNLGIHGGSHAEMTATMFGALEQCIAARSPDWVLVYGDTNSTLAASLAAAKLNVPIAHVESGLRSYNRRMPEEVNRVVTDHLSTLLFCPTSQSRENLVREGITEGVHVIGDVMFDACRAALRRLEGSLTGITRRLGLEGRAFAVATIHRAENVDEPERLKRVLTYLREHAHRRHVVIPIHPRTRRAILRHRFETDPLQVCDPVSYLEMAELLSGCECVLTDSGGLQKEAYFFGKPCVTLRDETEWVETVECGWNRLWTVENYRPRRTISEYGDGNAAQCIAQLLAAASTSSV